MPRAQSTATPARRRPAPGPAAAPTAASRRSWGRRVVAALVGGASGGNEQLTAMVGVLLVVLLAALGVTILRIRQLIWPHLFLGLLLLGPVALKLASTGYRFARYYLRSAIYRANGPPLLALRAMGPVLVLSTVAVFASGIVLLFEGPARRNLPLLIHKVSFILWLGLFGLHLLAHVPGLPRSLRAARAGRSTLAAAPELHRRLGGGGAAGRWIALVGALVAGLVVAIALSGHFGVWTAPGAFPHHHHHG
jgi:hypothetical protein